MRATEMHDLLKDAYNALLKNPIHHNGDGQFSHIRYCRYCSYSSSHGHDEDCVVSKLERAVCRDSAS